MAIVPARKNEAEATAEYVPRQEAVMQLVAMKEMAFLLTVYSIVGGLNTHVLSSGRRFIGQAKSSDETSGLASLILTFHQRTRSIPSQFFLCSQLREKMNFCGGR